MIKDSEIKTRRKAADRAREEIIERLAARFPELTPEQIAASVHGEYEGYQSSPIQDFVPILVEKSVTKELSGSQRHHRA